MVFKLEFKSDNTIILPVNYQHIVQGFIYNIISEVKEYSNFLHNFGYSFGKRKFKLFNFSLVQGLGKVKIENKIIYFYGNIVIEIRSNDDLFCKIMSSILKNQKYFKLGQNYIKLVNIDSYKKIINNDNLKIKAISLITVYSTKDRKTFYYNPFDEKFPKLINENFEKKYFSFFNKEPESIIIKPLIVRDKDKFVTKFKNISYITAWGGEYELKGKKEYLEFLYNTGLGNKNSEGFGMFEVI